MYRKECIGGCLKVEQDLYRVGVYYYPGSQLNWIDLST